MAGLLQRRGPVQASAQGRIVKLATQRHAEPGQSSDHPQRPIEL